MGKIAFVFSGQGAQVPGMGQALAASSAAAAAVYDIAETLRPGTRAQCAQASKQELSLTLHTQPCLFCVDLAAAAALRARGCVPDMVAGFSLGEIPALAFAGVLDTRTAFALVMRRAEAMHACAEATDGGMSAVLGLSDEAVEAICAQVGDVYPVNYNCPGQVVIAGHKHALPAAHEAVKAAGGKVLPLPVSGAFHSPLMRPAGEALAEHLQDVTLSAPKLPLFSNVTAQPYAPPYAQRIIEQVTSPVRWRETIQTMAEGGADTFVEVGVGKTLCGLIRKILPEARVLNVEDPESLETTLLALQNA